jgi:hypothetical protein
MMHKSIIFTTIFYLKKSIFRVKKCYFHYDMQKNLFLCFHLEFIDFPFVKSIFKMAFACLNKKIEPGIFNERF